MSLVDTWCHPAFVRPRHTLYRQYSEAVWGAIREVVPRVEQVGIDEGYLDLGTVVPTGPGGTVTRGDVEAAPYIRALAAAVPAEADAATARLAYRRGVPEIATEALVAAFTRYRTDPWPQQFPMGRGLTLALEIASSHPEHARRLYEALTPPFAIGALEQQRRFVRVFVAQAGGLWKECAEANASLEAHFPWRLDMLRARAECYRHTGDARAGQAARDLQAFQAADATPSAGPASPITRSSGTPR